MNETLIPIIINYINFLFSFSKCLNNSENIDLINYFFLKNKIKKENGSLSNTITIKCNDEVFIIDLKQINFNIEQDNIIKTNNLFTYIGIILALLGAFTIGIVETTIKKLCIEKVHYSISIIYGGYFGIPISLLISIFFYSTGLHAHSSSSLLINNPIIILKQIGYSFLSGFFGVMAQLFLNFALAYEDASKIAIFKTTDLIFTFLFQFYLVGIKKDLYSSLGAFLILFGTFLILVYKFLDNKLSNNNVNNSQNYSNIFLKILFFKF